MADSLTAFIVGAAAVVLLVRYGWIPIRWVLGENGQSAAQPAGSDAAVSPPANSYEPPPPGAPPTDEQRLARLRTDLENIGNSISAPTELSETPEFREARKLLADHAHPVATVADRAIGSNWALGAAAFAALEDRDDGGTVAADICAALDRCSAWQLHYAFNYLAKHAHAVKPRSRPFLATLDWWSTSTVIVDAARNYLHALEMRLDDIALAPEFDHASPEKLKCIRDLLAE